MKILSASGSMFSYLLKPQIVMVMFIFYSNSIVECISLELMAFLQFITGAPAPVGRIFVTFDDNEGAEAISVNTCGRQLILSTRIVEEDMFIAAIKALIMEQTFTMP